MEVSPERLADVFLYLQDTGVANINLVTATHVANDVARALTLAKPKLRIPVVYNTSSYEKVDSIARLDGLVDVYLPDLKFCSSQVSAELASAPDYFDVATTAIAEMKRQQPTNKFDAQGYITNGVIIRHLVLPGFTEDTKKVLDWISAFDKSSCVSLMSQYFPARTDDKYPQLNRRLFLREYESAKEYFFNVGLSVGYCQDVSSATRDYLPSFDRFDVANTLAKVPFVFDAVE